MKTILLMESRLIIVITEKKRRLKKFYVTGMRGTGERYLLLIVNAKKETGLTTDEMKAIANHMHAADKINKEKLSSKACKTRKHPP